MLLHFVILTDKIAVLDQALATQIGDQEVLRWQLPANIFVQLLAGPSEVRDGITGVFLWLIALVTLVISPVLLLLFFELQFLPYHGEFITWLQRVAVGIDLGLLWLFWPRIALRKLEVVRVGQSGISTFYKIQRVWTTGTMWILSIGSPVLLLAIASFPGEELQKHSFNIPGKELFKQVRAFFIDGDLNKESLLPESLFSSRLMLPKFDAVGQAKLDSKEKLDYAVDTIVIHGRQLQGANLKLADLRKADFIADDLTDADLGSANLTNARLDLAHLTGAKLDFANLTNARLDLAHLTNANLDFANLTNARLARADLTGAVLTKAQLTNANLNFANLTNVNLTGADLTGADLTGAELTGVDLSGADLTNANLTGADLRDTKVAQIQLDKACGDKATLPPNHTLKPCASP